MKTTLTFFLALLLVGTLIGQNASLQSMTELNHGYVGGVQWQGHWAGIRYMTHHIDIYNVGNIQNPITISENAMTTAPNCLGIYESRYLLIGRNQHLSVWDLNSTTPNTPIGDLTLTGAVISVTTIENMAYLTVQESDGKYKLSKVSLQNPSIPLFLSNITFSKPLSPLFVVGNQAFMIEKHPTSGKLYTFSVDSQGNLTVSGIVITPQAQLFDVQGTSIFVSGNNLLTEYNIVSNNVPVLHHSQSLNTPLGMVGLGDGKWACAYPTQIKLMNAALSTTFATASAPIFIQELDGYILFSTATTSYILDGVISTAIDPSTSISLAAYPNPATDSWHFDTEALQGEHTLFTLHNTQGQIVMQESWDGLSGTESIAVPQPGMYFYSLVQEGRTIAKGKLIGK